MNVRFASRLMSLAAAAIAMAHAAATPAAVPVPNPPAIEARGYLLIDASTNQTLAALNDTQRMEPASITKLMTAYAVFSALREKRLALTDNVLISEHAWRAEGSRTFVQVGTEVPVEVLLKGMIVQSGNDATIALAEKVGGTETAFVELMNTYAKQLGMTDTHYDNASGLPSPQHYSTARDIATLTRAIIRDFPEYYSYYSIREFTWNKIRQPNRNGLLARDPSVDGVKTGHTDSAGYCLVTSSKRQSTRLISVVLGTKSERAREDASAALLNYGHTFYESLPLKKRGETVLSPRVYKASDDLVAVGPASDVAVTVPRGQSGSVTTQATLRRPLIAPLYARTAVGELQVSVGGKVVQKVPLYPLADVPEGGFFSRLYDTVALWFE